MAPFASLNARQQDVGCFLAFRRAGMTFDAFQEFVRVVIEDRVLKPSLGDVGLCDGWKRGIYSEIERMALRARFPPEEFFRFRHS